jgi:S-disulfanyl-L-cysteine oxidoreductase SoxD
MKFPAVVKPVAILLLALATIGAEDTPPRTTWDGVYSAEQAVRGKKAYVMECARCHGDKLEGKKDDEEEAPAMTGKEFLEGWYGKPVGRMVDVTRRTMPPETAGTMSRPMTLDIVAYLLSENGFPAGKADLPTNAAALREIMIEPKK